MTPKPDIKVFCALFIRMRKFLVYALPAALVFAVVTQHSAWAKNSAPQEESAAPESRLIKLNPLMVPILKGKRVTKYVILKIDLEPAPDVDTEAITHDLPRVYDALLRETYLLAKENDGAEDIDIEALRIRLMSAINSVLHDKKINALYFTGLSTIKA